MLVWMEGEASSVHRTPKNCHFAWFITHSATTHIFVHAHVLFLEKTVHTSSSTLHSYCSKIIGHFEWRKMARGRDKLPWKPDSRYPSLLKSISGISVERPYPGHTNSVSAP